MPLRADSPRAAVRPAGAYASLYSFSDGETGSNPLAGLTAFGGSLYGTTDLAGLGDGTVFQSNASGEVSAVYRFAGPPDGAYPASRLVALGDKLYGTTTAGGKEGSGAVFAVSPSGGESVVYSFGKGGGGWDPNASLVVAGGLLYGTTRDGGAHAKGVVFSLTPSGTERVLHSFSGSPDGGSPSAGLTRYGGEFYGVTRAGGKNAGAGAVFRIDASGNERVLHSFGVAKHDGSNPAGELVAYKGVLYGTTIHGGSVGKGYGTVFAVHANGDESVLHSFGVKDDGAYPFAGLVAFGGVLYGTTQGGGFAPQNPGYCIYYEFAQHDESAVRKCGTVFEVTTSGRESVLYRFTGDPDGANPIGGLVIFAGALYGTTYWGGSNAYYGTIFRVLP